MAEGKIALVTGAAKGIGRAIALALAAEKVTVVVNYNGSKERAEAVVEEIKALGADGYAYQCNVADTEATRLMVKEIFDRYGRLDILVNNAGMSDSTKVEKYEEGQFDKVMRLNVNALFNAIQPAVEIMREQGGGCILNTSSMVSISGQPGGVAYPTSKFAVNGMTLSLARELGPSNIRVNAVAPGITKTDMVAALPDQMIQPMIAAIPLRRIGEPEDIANAFLFLASDMASYVTGEILSVDGAMRA